MSHCAFMVTLVGRKTFEVGGVDSRSTFARTGVQVMEKRAGSRKPLGRGLNVEGLLGNGSGAASDTSVCPCNVAKEIGKAHLSWIG